MESIAKTRDWIIAANPNSETVSIIDMTWWGEPTVVASDFNAEAAPTIVEMFNKIREAADNCVGWDEIVKAIDGLTESRLAEIRAA